MTPARSPGRVSTVVRWEVLCHASTARPPQQNDRCVFLNDFPQRLEEESGLSWSEIARRLGTCHHTVWRWWQAGVRPNQHHTKALLDLADDFGLGYLFTE